MLRVEPGIEIPLREFRFRFSRSAGPGGQNVNKVNTKVTLRWNVEESSSLPDDLRERFLSRYRRRMAKGGDLLLTSQRFRDQGRNVADCLEKLRGMLSEVARPVPRRRRTRPRKSAVESRLREKQRRAAQKRQRRRVPDED